MSRLLFLQEHVRVDHTIEHNDGTVTIDFLSSTTGKKLLTETNKHGITRRDLEVAYVYPEVPEPTKVTKAGRPISYKDVPLGEASNYHGQLIEMIVEKKPEIVIPNGRLGCKFLIDAVSIMQNRGVPVEKTLTNEAGESHTFWVLPIYSMEFMTLRPSVSRQVEMDLGMVKQYLEEGDSAFLPSDVSYDYIKSMEEVREVFSYIREHKPTTAWDLETNTLKPEMDGAKALVISLSWEAQTGKTIPLEHKDFVWEPEELEELLDLMKEFVGDPDIPKVGANIKFDIRFLISAYGFKYFRNNMDVQIGYWMTVSQERDGSRRLSNLAYEFTDMGGYDDELEDWIKEYKAEYRKEHKKKPENEIDCSDFNYEWIPYDMLIEYAAGDADVTLRVHEKILERVNKNPKWIEMYTQFYPRMSAAIAQTEANGLHLDLEYAREIAVAYVEEEERLVQEMRELPSVKIVEEEYRAFYDRGLQEWEKKPADRDKEIAKWRNKYRDKLEFNPRSGADKGKVMFDVLGVRPPLDKDYVKAKAWSEKNPKTIDDLDWEDFSTNRAVLDEVMSGNYSEEAKKLAELMVQFSSVATLRSTFAEKAEDDMADDGAIHGNLNINGTACVTGDTLINTNEGIIPIEKLSKNREPNTFSDVDLDVVTREGVHEVGGFYYQGTAEGRKIELADGNEITVTNNHQVLVSNFLKRGKAANRAQTAYQQRHRYDNVWRRADELTTDDYVVVNYGSELYGSGLELTYDREEYKPKTNAHKQLRLPREMSEDLAEFLGMFMADGTYSTNNGSFSFNLSNNNREVTDLFEKHVENLFGITCRYLKGSAERSSAVEFSSVNLGRYLADNFQITSVAGTKNVPEKILKAPKRIQQAFIRGLTLDTGTQKKVYPHIYFSSTSKEMMKRLQAMLMNMGLYVRMAERKAYGKNRTPQKEVMISGDSVEMFMNEIGFIESKKAERVRKALEEYEGVGHYHGTYDEPDIKTAFVRIKRIVKVEDEFFDINVPHNSSYLGNSIINHNTSRLSSSGPNLQNIVATHNNVHKFDYHHPIKRMYTSRFDDGVILEADYSALEMRILGLVAGDPEMTQTFMEDGDIHKNTASIINHKPEDEVTYDEREASKAVSFGIIYGKGVPGLSGDLGVSVPEAQEVYDQFMRTKPSVAAYIDGVHDFIKQHGYVETLQGHRRNLQDVFGNRTAEAGALRQSVNTIN